MADARCVRDGTASPAPLLGHIPAEAAVHAWALVEAGIFLAACVTAGAILGVIVAAVRRP